MREHESEYKTYSFMKVETDIMFTQMSTKAGILKFGEKEVEAIIK